MSDTAASAVAVAAKAAISEGVAGPAGPSPPTPPYPPAPGAAGVADHAGSPCWVARICTVTVAVAVSEPYVAVTVASPPTVPDGVKTPPPLMDPISPRSIDQPALVTAPLSTARKVTVGSGCPVMTVTLAEGGTMAKEPCPAPTTSEL